MYTKESKCISYLLRHAKNKIEAFEIDKEGWVEVEYLIAQCGKQGYPITTEILFQIVSEDQKGRYSFNHNKSKIRAVQGHSVDVDLKLKKSIPPSILFHGTSYQAFEGIKKTGIQRMKRNHVHLSDNIDTASSVGARHGKKLVISIDCKAMIEDGIDFFKSENGVWLTSFVDIKYFTKIN